MKFKTNKVIGFEQNEVNALLDPAKIKAIKLVEEQRKNDKRINQTRLNNSKFEIFGKRKNKKLKYVKQMKNKLQIDKGFDLAQKWCPFKKEEEKL